ncbi:DUF5060 domain-containing protein [Sphingomonas sp. JC676]|uniref:DUF5060 domain-containing protein n=1 Tax=Sphingomonas sp. JC676 TaxID=2768065 RepID=UPI001657E89D|nr:DUF5060 domain-containing protein [Sphingomonas sp. JC676]MBC9031975.1 DUF5060 domain-containing protein [Sphingomonas sp. JC676]
MSLLGFSLGVASAATIDGERKQWHDIQLTFAGPKTSETADPNPFRDYRLNVTFTHGDKVYVVPGYFAADGNAAETGATEGNLWRVNFVPDATGTWTYQVSFRTGSDVAVSLDPKAGSPVSFNGEKGKFEVKPSDKTGRDNRANGMLQYANKHFLRYAGTGKYFVMAGTQSPENFLAYYEFDNTKDYRGQKGLPYPDQLHHYDPHVKDWKPGDPTWQGGKGKGIIGALNYLAGKGMNSFYTLTMNNYGDAMDTNPWIAYDEHTRYDVSKLAQWEIVFSHMDRLGMQVMMITQEEEGEQTLGKMTVERKLYYRELIARFAHHHGIIWDLDEEMDRFRYFTTQDTQDIANYIKALDPYKHPIQYVQWKAEMIADDKTYGRLLGFPNFDSTALQHDPENTHSETIKWLDKSAAAGHPWLVQLIEMNPGVRPDVEDRGHNKVRKLAIWGHYMAGGTGTMFFFTDPIGDLNMEDFRSRDQLFDLIRYAHDFVSKYLPFDEMRHADELTSLANDYVLAKPGQAYAVYLPDGGTTALDLSGASGTFEVKWYNPRTGGDLKNGSVRTVEGGASRALGKAPSDVTSDWAVLVRRVGTR